MDIPGALWCSQVPQAAYPVLRVIGAHTLSGVSERSLSMQSLHVLPVSPWVCTKYPHQNIQWVKNSQKKRNGQHINAVYSELVDLAIFTAKIWFSRGKYKGTYHQVLRDLGQPSVGFKK